MLAAIAADTSHSTASLFSSLSLHLSSRNATSATAASSEPLGVMCFAEFKFVKVTNIDIRILQKNDCEIISLAFKEQGWNKPTQQYLDYLIEQNLGKRLIILGFIDNVFVGYFTILWQSEYSYFFQNQIPEIMDLNVLIKYQRLQVATKLMDYAENLILNKSNLIGIGVGMTQDYGNAQRLYIKRGYIPDSNGLIQNDKTVSNNDTIIVNDNLALYLIKSKL